MGWAPNYQSEARIYADYLVKNHPQGKIGILYQNDDYGKDYVKGLKDCTAISSSRCSTPITTRAAFCRSTSMRRQAASRWR